MTHLFKTTVLRLTFICMAVASLSACVSVGIGIPLGPFGSIGLGVNGAGQITGNIGVMGHIGAVGIGASTNIPLGSVAPAPVAAQTQTGASQNVPR